MKMLLPQLSIPPEIPVPASDMPWSRRPRKAGKGSSMGKDQVLEMLSNGSCVPQIVKLSKQSVMESLQRSPSDLANIDGSEAGNIALNRALIDKDGFRYAGVATSGSTTPRGKRDVAFGLKAQKEPTTNHVLGLSIKLSPVPGVADSAGQSSPVIIRVALDQIPDEIDLPCTDGAASVNEYRFHASMGNTFLA
jgi:hypothetical protein